MSETAASAPGDSDHGTPRELVHAAATLVRACFDVAPGQALASFLLEPAAAALTVLMGLWLKLVVDAALQGDTRRAVLAAVALTASFALSRAMAALGLHLRMGLQERVGFALEEHLARVVARTPGLETFERPDHLDRLDLLRRQRDYFWFSLSALVQGLREGARLIGTLVLLAAVDPLLLLLPVLGLPTLLGGIAARRFAERAAEATAEDERLAEHLLHSAMAAGPGREVRIFGLADQLERRWAGAAAKADAAVLRAELRAALWQTAAWIGFALGFVAAVVLVTLRAVRGNATAGDVLLVVTLAGGVAANVRSMATWVSELTGALRFLARYTAVIRAAEKSGRRSVGQSPAPARLDRGITLADVSFRYPGTEGWVLRDVNLHLPAGSTVALVGENGAGKTTLVKLLCRFYEPTEGQIVVDGRDLADIDVQEWRTRMSAGFQDFARLELLAREAVGVGDLSRMEDERSVLAALDRAGASDILGQLDRGLGMQLGTTWGGTDLSGGQWQKLALGRAMMRERPLLLVLDEPTASLDAETEHALFERYATAARGRAADGVITVLVSHRFSTVRMADLIVVLDGGRVREAGHHEELMARGGLYAELYALQARVYR